MRPVSDSNKETFLTFVKALAMTGEVQKNRIREDVINPTFYNNVAKSVDVAAVQESLYELIEELQIEFCMLVSSTDYGVLVSGTHTLSPNTKTFNPDNIVSDFVASNEDQQIRTIQVPREVFKAHSAPEHVDEEAANSGGDAHAGHGHGGHDDHGGHEDEEEGTLTWDIDSPTLVRFVLTKVSSLDSGVPSGVLVVGDAITVAKPDFVRQTLVVLQSGMAAFALKQSDGSIAVPVHAEYIGAVDDGHGHGDAEGTVLVDGMHSTDLALVQKAIETPGKVFLQSGTEDPHGHKFTLAMVTVPGTEGIVLIRSFEETFLRNTITSVAIWNFGLLAVVIIIDIVGVAFGIIQLFLKPLDVIIKKSKSHDYEGFSDSIAKMRRSKVLIVRFIVTGAVSLVVLGITLYTNLNALEAGFVHLTTTSTQAHAMEDTYMITSDQMKLSLSGRAQENAFREASDVNSANRAQARVDVTAILKQDSQRKQMEMAILVGEEKSLHQQDHRPMSVS